MRWISVLACTALLVAACSPAPEEDRGATQEERSFAAPGAPEQNGSAERREKAKDEQQSEGSNDAAAEDRSAPSDDASGDLSSDPSDPQPTDDRAAETDSTGAGSGEPNSGSRASS